MFDNKRVDFYRGDFLGTIYVLSEYWNYSHFIFKIFCMNYYYSSRLGQHEHWAFDSHTISTEGRFPIDFYFYSCYKMACRSVSRWQRLFPTVSCCQLSTNTSSTHVQEICEGGVLFESSDCKSNDWRSKNMNCGKVFEVYTYRIVARYVWLQMGVCSKYVWFACLVPCQTKARFHDIFSVNNMWFDYAIIAGAGCIKGV